MTSNRGGYRPTQPTHACPDCGKMCYPTRKLAKQMAHRAHPGTHLSEYRCGDHWHIGHTPNAVIAGTSDRHLNPPWTSDGARELAACDADLDRTPQTPATTVAEHVKHTSNRSTT